jgi:hypothetical protein
MNNEATDGVLGSVITIGALARSFFCVSLLSTCLSLIFFASDDSTLNVLWKLSYLSISAYHIIPRYGYPTFSLSLSVSTLLRQIKNHSQDTRRKPTVPIGYKLNTNNQVKPKQTNHRSSKMEWNAGVIPPSGQSVARVRIQE